MNKLILLLAICCMLQSCKSHPKTFTPTKIAEQIGEYVLDVFEDSKGNLWFGTLSKGVAKYDGKGVQYLTEDDGLANNAVVDILEDTSNNIWMATQNGLSKFDGKEFTNYGVEQGLVQSSLSNILIDSKGKFWVGTWGGVSLFNGERFTTVELPKSSVTLESYQKTQDWITLLYEDEDGNIWIGTDGLGLLKYDGKAWQTYTNNEGLLSNNVCTMVQDQRGAIWVGSRIKEHDHPDPEKRFGAGGLNRGTGQTFHHFPEMEAFNQSSIYAVYKDSKEYIWIGTTGRGLYKFDGTNFIHYIYQPSLPPIIDIKENPPIQVIYEDSKGQIWLGCSGGLFKVADDYIVNVTTNGPW